jgi:stalled ribosome rescue protein Dom34
MDTSNYLGVWLDHASASIIKIEEKEKIQTILSAFTHQIKMESLKHSESGMHRKEEQLQEKFFQAISDEIKTYKNVVLFGPTDAKKELHNFLKKDHHFDQFQIHFETTDDLTPTEQKVFVKNYFHLD